MTYHLEFDIDLKRNEEKGLYIALEGIDGSGKTTQVQELKKYFESKGKEVVKTREPRKEGVIGELVHQILLGDRKFSPKAFQYLFTTDRVLNQEEIVLPALKRGAVVISDRAFWSGIVYGILDRMEDEYDVKSESYFLIAHSIFSFYHQFTIPDFTFYLHIPLNVSMQRIKEERGHRLEIYEREDKLRKVIDGYDVLFNRFKEEVNIVDGTKTIPEVTKEIVEIIEK